MEENNVSTGIQVIDPAPPMPLGTVTDPTLLTPVVADPAADATVAEGFFSSVYSKIRGEVVHLEGDAVAFEDAVQAKIEAFVSGIKAKLQSLHSGQ